MALTIPLLLYWPTIFVLTHMRIPQLVRKAGLFDKTLHFLAFLILFFLFWFAVGFGRKLQWRKTSTWLVFFTVVAYGALDEWLQIYVGRSCNIPDFLANLSGCVAGLVLLTFFSFWPALLIVTGIAIFLLSNMSQNDLSKLLPVTTSVFYLFAYMFFTLVWIRNVQFFLLLGRTKFKWLVVSLAAPMALLLSVKIFPISHGNEFVLRDVIISVIGIVIVVSVIFLVCLFANRATKELSDSVV